MVKLPANFKGEFNLVTNTFTYTFFHDESSDLVTSFADWLSLRESWLLEAPEVILHKAQLEKLSSMMTSRLLTIYMAGCSNNLFIVEYNRVEDKLRAWLDELSKIKIELINVKAFLKNGVSVESDMLRIRSQEYP
ncbi:MAG: hypothetical protein Q9220_003817 [cf. Caloplaca sp. 1 TL-2023]